MLKNIKNEAYFFRVEVANILSKLNAQEPISRLENKIKTELKEKAVSLEEIGMVISKVPKKTKVYTSNDVWEYLKNLDRDGFISLAGIKSFDEIVEQRLYSSDS
ncbi:MAG: hypothetical protein QXX91_01695 [Thermoplasmata archaeon]